MSKSTRIAGLIDDLAGQIHDWKEQLGKSSYSTDVRHDEIYEHDYGQGLHRATDNRVFALSSAMEIEFGVSGNEAAALLSNRCNALIEKAENYDKFLENAERKCTAAVNCLMVESESKGIAWHEILPLTQGEMRIFTIGRGEPVNAGDYAEAVDVVLAEKRYDVNKAHYQLQHAAEQFIEHLEALSNHYGVVVTGAAETRDEIEPVLKAESEDHLASNEAGPEAALEYQYRQRVSPLSLYPLAACIITAGENARNYFGTTSFISPKVGLIFIEQMRQNSGNWKMSADLRLKILASAARTERILRAFGYVINEAADQGLDESRAVEYYVDKTGPYLEECRALSSELRNLADHADAEYWIHRSTIVGKPDSESTSDSEPLTATQDSALKLLKSAFDPNVRFSAPDARKRLLDCDPPVEIADDRTMRLWLHLFCQHGLNSIGAKAQRRWFFS